MLIKNIHIENFKRFKNLNVDLLSLDCLVGINNSGKSTMLQGLALFDFVVHNCLSRKNVNGNGHEHKYPLEIKNRSIAPEEFIVLPVANAIDLWTDKIPQKNGKHIIIGIEIKFNNDKVAKATLDLNYNRFTIALITDDSQEWLEELVNFKISYLPVFSSFLTQEERRTPAVIEDALARGRVNSIIRNLLYNLNEQGKIGQLEKILQNAIPTFTNLEVKFDEISDRYIDVSYTEEGKKKHFDLFMAGSGFQQFIYLFGFILLRNPNVVLLDEPDVHLHGALQGALLKELKNLVAGNKQVVFATHSKDLITRIEPDHIISLNDGDAKRLQVKFDIYDTLESLGSMDNIQLAQLQNFKRLLVVEDISDWNFLQIFGKKILGDATWQKIEKRLAIFPAKGNPYKQDMSRLKHQLVTMFSLSETKHTLKLLVISDLDYYPDRQELISEKERDPDIQFHIWERNEIENYLLIPAAITRLVESKSPGKDLFQDGIENEFITLLNNSKDEVEEKFIAGFEYYRGIKKNGWDGIIIHRKIKELMNERWNREKISLTDAKDNILPGLKRWLQKNGFKQFSDHSLAESLLKEELPDEVHHVVNKILKFTQVSTEK